jgi:hypothetical protein
LRQLIFFLLQEAMIQKPCALLDEASLDVIEPQISGIGCNTAGATRLEPGPNRSVAWYCDGFFHISYHTQPTRTSTEKEPSLSTVVFEREMDIVEQKVFYGN